MLVHLFLGRNILCVCITWRALKMISDVQLALFANILGVLVFVLVVLYHYVAANNPKKMSKF